MANKIQKGIKREEEKACRMVLFCWFHMVHNGTLHSMWFRAGLIPRGK